MVTIFCRVCEGEIRFFNSQCICEEIRVLKELTADILAAREHSF